MGRHTGGFSVFGGVGSGGSSSPWIEFTKTGMELMNELPSSIICDLTT
jgi:hypothetical protein